MNSFYSLIHPEPEYYQWFCQQVHGLSEEDTEDAPVFPYVWEKIAPMIEGLPLVAQTARDMGIRSPLDVTPALSLGSSDVNLLELVNGYCTVVNNGRAPSPVMVTHIIDNLENHHHALADAEACARIALKIL